jgi:signal transduction histidine kinase
MNPLPASWTSQRAYRLAGPLAAVLAVGVLVTNELAYRADAELVARREQAVETRFSVGRARRTVLLMESAQRGYMLTGRAEYRGPFDEAVTQSPQMLEALRTLADKSPVHRANLLLLLEATNKKLSELTEVMRVFDAGERDRALTLLLTDIGREHMERINDLVEELVSKEDLASARANQQRGNVRVWTLSALCCLVVLCLGAAIASLRLNRDRDRERVRYLIDLQSERDKLEGEVDRRTQDLTALARHLQTVREDERRHLARELHDELGGLLTAAKLDVARMRKRLVGTTPEVLERISHLSETLDAGIALKRRIIEDLSPSSLSNLGLQRTLEIQCAEFGKRADLQVHTSIAEVALTEERQLAVYRIVQEALTNVAKYAQAKHVQVNLQPDGEDHVCVQVRDDGVGFDPALARTGAHGLAGMQFRVQSCGGEWRLESTPGGGTLVQARLPAVV